MAEVGKHIKKIRKEKNLTQDELAERLHCTRQTISNYETGKSEPDIALLIELAGVLEVEIGDLIYGPKKKENKLNQKKRAVAVLVTAGVLLAVIRILQPFAQKYGYYYFEMAPTMLLQYVLKPLTLALLGWGIAEAGKAFADICIWKNRQQRTVRIIRICYYVAAVILAVSALMALCTAAELIYVWWKTSQMKLQESFDYTAISLGIQDWVISCYMRVIVINRLGGAGLFLGMALSLCKVNKIEKKEPDTGNEIEG